MGLPRRLRVPTLIVALLVFLSLFNLLLTHTIYNPAFAVPLYGWAERQGLLAPSRALRETLSGSSPVQYPLRSIAEVQSLSDGYPRAKVIGRVTALAHNLEDGDWHLNLTGDRGRTLVVEIVPEYPLPLPKVGERIAIWGIVRYDVGHRWWEIHPAFGWKPAR